MSDSHKPLLLNPSHLGTQTYWDHLYTRELANNENDEDEGTVWFEENGAEEAVIALLEDLEHRGHLSRRGRVLDVGTGNGHMLFELRGDWEGEMIGVDYSQAGIDLALRINQQRGLDLAFHRWDLLQDEPSSLGQFDLILDKGTFDAISLMSQIEINSCEVYCRKVLPLLKNSGLLVVTSCNWTKPELLAWFKTGLEYLDEAKYPSFTFGGKTGQSIVTIAFLRTS